MSPVFAARRHSEEFASLIENASTGQPADARYSDLLEVVELLRDTPTVEPRPSFVANLRDRLMLVAGAALATSETPERLVLPPRQKARDRRVAAAVGGFALVGATTSMAMAAQSALPGDVLYPLKRAMESAQREVSVGEGQRGETLLANAYGRLDEINALSRHGDLKDAPVIADTLNDFTLQATEASDLLLSDYFQTGRSTLVSGLRDFTSLSLDQLTALEALVPTEARDELLNAAQVVFQIDAAARQACPTCGGAGISVIPNVFATMSSGASTWVRPDVGGEKKSKKGGGQEQAQPEVPAVEGEALPPGSVLTPDAGANASGPPPSSEDSGNPLKGLSDGLSGGGGSQPASNPTTPDVNALLAGTAKIVEDATKPVVP